MKRSIAVATAAIAILLAFAAPAMARPVFEPDGVEVYDRDVYVIVGSTLRNPDETTAADAPLFNVAGVNLGLTWGQFRAASAPTARANATGDRTDVRVTLNGLVPGGVYSLFYFTLNPDSENPLCPGVERSLPLVERFTADATGGATLRARGPGGLLDAQQLIYSVIWHFDGQTYGSLPNRGEFETQGEGCRSSFGEDAFRQLLITQQRVG